MAKFFGTYHYVDVPDDVAETEYGAGPGQSLVVIRKDVYDALMTIMKDIPVIEWELLDNAGADISDLLEELETGDCLDSEYLGPDAPQATSAQDDAFTLLSTALVQFGERGVPTLLQTGEMEITIEWQSAYTYCVNVICWGDGRYQLYVFDREMIGHLWQPTTLVDEPRAGLDDVAAALQGYVDYLDQQDATRTAVPADLV